MEIATNYLGKLTSYELSLKSKEKKVIVLVVSDY